MDKLSKLDNPADKLIDEILEFNWKSMPVSATISGIHKYDHLIGGFSRDKLNRINEKTKVFLSRLEKISPEELNKEEKIDYVLLINELKSEIKDFEEIRFWEKDPGMSVEICMYGIFIMGIREIASLKERAECILSRLEKIPGVLQEGKKNLKNSPKVFTHTAIEITQGGIKFFEIFIPQLAEKIPGLKGNLLKANRKVLSAMQNYLDFLEREYLVKSQGDFAIGKDLFNWKLKNTHMLPYDTNDLLNIGDEIFKKTKEELAELAKKIDSTKTWWELVNGLKDDHPQPDELIDAYRKEMERSREFVQKYNIVDIPEDESLEIIPTPVFERATTPYAAYMPPAPFEKEQKGLFYVTPVNETADNATREEQLQGHAFAKIPVTVVHEGYPGHHLQLTRSNRLLSKVRKMYHTSVFVEGWALYCEELMNTVGYYNDSKVSLIKLKDQLWRACRVIIDVKLHTKEMDFTSAVDFLVKEAKLEKTNAISEVKRYCLTPTQPMSYIIGKLQITQLRDECKKKYGAKFDLKKFHETLLSFGSIPVELIRKNL